MHPNPRAGSLLPALFLLAAAAIGRVEAHDHPQAHTHVAMTNQPRTAMTWYRDIVYDPSYRQDPHLVSLDIYAPEPAKERMPVVIFVHGGGFRGSDKAYYKDLGRKPDWLTRDMGYLFISMNFRFLPDGGFPASFQDVANAVAWTHDHISEYGGDPEKLVLFGHATGLHQAALVATDPVYLRNAGKDPGVLKGLIGVDGAFFDVTRSGSGVVRNILPNADLDALRKASPLHYVAPGKSIPPTLILYGGQGGDVKADAEAMAGALRGAGVPVTSLEMLDKDHFTANEDIGIPGDATTIAVQRFLEELGFQAAN